MFQSLINTLTHPATLPIIGMLVLVLLVFLTLNVVSPGTKPRERQFSDNPMMNALGWLGAILAVPGLIILIAAGWELIVLAVNFPDLTTPPGVIRWHSSIMLAMLAAIGAIFTLLFAYIRSFATERQTRATEEALFNDKINTAANDLHARRLVTKNPDDEDGHWDCWQDDIIKRNAAINRLEGLVRENPETAERVARMLSIYVRELSREHEPVAVPDGATPDELRLWAWNLTACRSGRADAWAVAGD